MSYYTKYTSTINITTRLVQRNTQHIGEGFNSCHNYYKMINYVWHWHLLRNLWETIDLLILLDLIYTPSYSNEYVQDRKSIIILQQFLHEQSWTYYRLNKWREWQNRFSIWHIHCNSIRAQWPAKINYSYLH